MPGGRRQGPPSDIIENAFPTLDESAGAAERSKSTRKQDRQDSNAPNWVGGSGRITAQRTFRGRVSIRSEKDFPGLGGSNGRANFGDTHSMSAVLRRQGRGQHENRSETPPSTDNERDFPSMPRGPPGGRLGVFREPDRRRANIWPRRLRKGEASSKIETFLRVHKLLESQVLLESRWRTVAVMCPRIPLQQHGLAHGVRLINKGTSHCTACGAAAIYGMRVLKSKKEQEKRLIRHSQVVVMSQHSSRSSSCCKPRPVRSSNNESKDAIAGQIRSILGEKKFPIFQRLCGAYARQRISAQGTIQAL